MEKRRGVRTAEVDGVSGNVKAILDSYSDMISVDNNNYTKSSMGDPTIYMNTSENLMYKVSPYFGNLFWHTIFTSEVPNIEVSEESKDTDPEFASALYDYLAKNINEVNPFGWRGLNNIIQKAVFDYYTYGNVYMIIHHPTPKTVEIAGQSIRIAVPNIYFANPNNMEVQIVTKGVEPSKTYVYSASDDYDKFLENLIAKSGKRIYVFHLANNLFQKNGYGMPYFWGSFRKTGNIERMNYFDQGILDTAYGKLDIIYPEAITNPEGRIISANPRITSALTALLKDGKNKTNMMTFPYPVKVETSTFGSDQLIDKEMYDVALDEAASGWGIPGILLFGKGSTRDEVVVRSFLEKCYLMKSTIITPIILEILLGVSDRSTKFTISRSVISLSYKRTNLYTNWLENYRAGLISRRTYLNSVGEDYDTELLRKKEEESDEDYFEPVDVNFAGRTKDSKETPGDTDNSDNEDDL